MIAVFLSQKTFCGIILAVTWCAQLFKSIFPWFSYTARFSVSEPFS